jgi:high-affinity iron transporter
MMRVILLTVVVLCLGTGLGLEAWTALAAGGDAAKGKVLYEGRGGCVNCHGAAGRGDGPAGKMLNPPPADFANQKSKAKKDAELLKTIQDGRTGTAMAAFKGQLSEQEIRDVLAYVRSLSK